MNAKTLKNWEEVLGILEKVDTHDGEAVLTIGDIEVIIPDLTLVKNLGGRIGERIGILRTDLPGKEFLFRLINKDEKGSKSDF